MTPAAACPREKPRPDRINIDRAFFCNTNKTSRILNAAEKTYGPAVHPMSACILHNPDCQGLKTVLNHSVLLDRPRDCSSVNRQESAKCCTESAG
jgi:hypothetical protein